MQIQRFIRRAEVLAKTGLSATTIYNLEKRGDFPHHFMLTPRCAAWDEVAVDTWLDDRKANPVQATPPPDVGKRKCVGKRKPANRRQGCIVRVVYSDKANESEAPA